MDALKDLLRSFRPAGSERLRIAASETTPFGAIDPRRLHVEVAAGASAHLVVLHAEAAASALTVELAEGAQLDLTELFLSEAFAEVSVSQAARSRCRMTAVELTSANAA